MIVRHPHGNIKIAFIKGIASLISKSILLVLKLFLDIDTKYNEIIISRATYAPWKIEDEFIKIYSKYNSNFHKLINKGKVNLENKCDSFIFEIN